MINKHYYKYNGEYNSISYFSKKYNIPYKNLLSRLHQGFTIKDAIETPIVKRKRVKQIHKEKFIKYNGEENTVKYFCEKFNLKYKTVMNRIYETRSTPQEILDYYRNKDQICRCSNAQIYTLYSGTKNEFTGTLTDISKKYKINSSTLRSRLKRGYSIEEIIKPIQKRFLVFKGTENEFLGSKREIANHFNIPYNVIRIGKYRGKTYEEIILNYNPKRIGDEIIVYKGTDKEFIGNKRQIVKHFHIVESTFLYRLKMGYTPEEAIEVPKQLVKINNLNYKDFKGNLNEICQYFNKNYIEVYNKLKYCHTLEWSIESTTKPYDRGEELNEINMVESKNL